MAGVVRNHNLHIIDKKHPGRYKGKAEATVDKPVAPEHLSERSKEIFEEFVKRLDQIGIASSTDTEAIVLYSKNQEELEYLERFLMQNGHTYPSESVGGNITYKKYPEAEIYINCKALKLKVLSEFGLTPNARNRVKVKPKDTRNNNPFADLDDE